MIIARPLCIDVDGGWYHVMPRGIKLLWKEYDPVFPEYDLLKMVI